LRVFSPALRRKGGLSFSRAKQKPMSFSRRRHFFFAADRRRPPLFSQGGLPPLRGSLTLFFPFPGRHLLASPLRRLRCRLPHFSPARVEDTPSRELSPERYILQERFPLLRRIPFFRTRFLIPPFISRESCCTPPFFWDIKGVNFPPVSEERDFPLSADEAAPPCHPKAVLLEAAPSLLQLKGPLFFPSAIPPLLAHLVGGSVHQTI